MADETDTSDIESETDNVETSADDTSDEWDYYDPDLDGPDTEGVAETDETEDEEADEADTPDEEASEEPEDEPDDQPAPKATEDATVSLADGTETTVGELIKGHMRQADYTRKAQELANTRKTLEADASRIETITNAFVDHLANLMPPEPDPGLIYSDPTKYSQQKAIYDQSLAQVQKLVELGSQPKEVTQKLSEEDHRSMIAEENSRLVSMFPEAGTQDGRQKFFGNVQAVANDLGFSTEELQQVTDHRIFALAHWAQKGMAAEKAKASAKAKVEKAPKAPPRKPGQGARKTGRGNRDAMTKLGKTGRLSDALNVDFD